ncbi:MAG: hypothetical protein H7831_15585 [Magnetococcus sp. WYHC-3]
MSKLVVIDTGVLLNILNVPGNNERYEDVMRELEAHLKAGDHLFLPLACILETGNHIADIKGGGELRRIYGNIFVNQVEKALRGEAPWKVIPFPDSQVLMTWLKEFPDLVMMEFGFADMAIFKAWKDLMQKHPLSEVIIWGTDSKWKSYG